MPAKIIVTPGQLLELVSAYRDGSESTRSLAARLGYCANTVNRLLKEAGVELNRAAKIQQRARPAKGSGTYARTEEHRKQMAQRAAGNQWSVGRRHSPETRAKISAATKGKNVRYTPEQRALREAVRQASKRFLRRVLKATGKSKVIPSALQLGYTPQELVAHLGPRPEGAHIDHRVPIVEFLRRGITDVAVINALVNLRWLDADANRRKSARVPDDADALIAACVAAGAAAGRGATYTEGA